MENSKKIYTEFSKLNLTKPLDLSNVKSVLKENISSSKLNDDELFKKPKHLSRSADLLIDAHNVDFKQLENLTSEIRNHKQKLAKLEFKPYKQNSSKKRNKSPKEHKGSIYNYRRAVKEIKSLVRFNSVESRRSLSPQELRVESQLDNKDLISKDHSIIREYQYLNTVFFSNNVSHEEKYKERIRQARDKILNEQIEKQNLNRMTILQPFEDTKILINIDQVPSGFLNSLLNKENNAPRYYMPPVRPFGYFKKVTDDKDYDKRFQSSKNSRNYMNRSELNELHAEQHNFNLESLKTINESSNFFTNKDHSILSNNYQTNSSSNFDLKVNISKKDVSVK
ncbi:unnamed protein product [Brachionus calyciflorus]|uniref:Uncharacterized protein n=1 Tax=Brachionus calyciflorus TaxID=104777 RepID=A0A814CNP9_9BILA|nr:unnamed protein product [Brachionus calyciflorus]